MLVIYLFISPLGRLFITISLQQAFFVFLDSWHCVRICELDLFFLLLIL